jgi:asparagine synthase (glutamine-hydrolysing)
LKESMHKNNSWRRGLGAFLENLQLAVPASLDRAGLGPWVETLGGLRSTWERYQRQVGRPRERLVFYNLAPDFEKVVHSIDKVYSPAFNETLKGVNPYSLFTFPRPWPRLDVLFTRLISQTYLLENGVVQGDRLSMASSVELRLPLLDHKLVETVIGLRKAQPDHHLPPKHMLREALKGILPDWVLNRPKRPFEPPTREWHEALFAAYGSHLEDGYLVQAGILQSRSARLLASGPFPKRAITPLSFKALVLELWARSMQAQQG